MRWLLALIVLAGCRDLLGIDDGKPKQPDAGADGARGDAGRDGMNGCASSFVAIGVLPHRYRRLTAATDWQNQRDTCAALGGYLVVPDDATELQEVTTFADNATLWLGIADMAGSGTYTTVLGSQVSYLPWDPGEPTVGGNKHCVLVLQNKQSYANEDCLTVEPTVCECTP